MLNAFSCLSLEEGKVLGMKNGCKSDFFCFLMREGFPFATALVICAKWRQDVYHT